MAYVRAYIEACPAYGWTGGPGFQTRIVTMANGRERRNANWAQPQFQYMMDYTNRPRSEYVNVLNMFMACKGQRDCFLFDDPMNNQADDQLIAVGDGVEDTYQLSALYVVDGLYLQRNVYAIPDSETITVTVAGSPITAFTLDYDRGIIVFDSPPTGEIRWSGHYNVWVRFAQDTLPFSLDSQNAQGYFYSGNVQLLEMPPPEEEVS